MNEIENLLAAEAERRSISLAELAEILEDQRPADLEKSWGIPRELILDIISAMVRIDMEEIMSVVSEHPDGTPIEDEIRDEHG